MVKYCVLREEYVCQKKKKEEYACSVKKREREREEYIWNISFSRMCAIYIGWVFLLVKLNLDIFFNPLYAGTVLFNF